MNNEAKVAMTIGYLKGLINGWTYTVNVNVDDLKKFIAELEK